MSTKQKIVCWYFIILPFIDLMTSLSDRFLNIPISLGMSIKGITLIICILYTIFYSKSKYKKNSILYLLLLSIFLILYFLTKQDIFNIKSILTEITYILKYFYFPIMLCCLINIFDDFKINNDFIKKIISINLIIYTILLLISYITNMFFDFYKYNNLGNEIGTIMIILLSAPAVSIYIELIIIIIINSLEKKQPLKNEITILALHLGFGGVEKYISSLTKMLEKDYKINIITTYKVLDNPAFEFSPNINISYLINDKPNKEKFNEALKNKDIINLFKEGFKAIKLLYLKRKRNKQAIKAIDSKYIITTRTFHNKLVSKCASKRIIKIATEHNHHNNDKKYIRNLIKSINNFDYLVTVSNSLYEFYKDKIGATRCVYIPNVLDNLPDKYTKLNQNVVINIGRLEDVKGQDDLIDIIYEVKKEIKDIKLYIIGDGSKYEKLKNKIKRLHLENNITLTGFLNKDEMEKYLTKSKLFIMTSHTESFGLVLIEAMSYKVACIAYDSADGAKEILKNNAGILIKNRNKDKMVKKIIDLLNNQDKIKELSQNGYINCQKYLLENIKKKWIKVLKEKV